MNLFNVMFRKRFNKDEEEEVDEEGSSKRGKRKKGNYFILFPVTNARKGNVTIDNIFQI